MLELLCFLLLHRDRAHTRDELSAVLWPDATSTLGRKYLRQALWRLQSALAAGLLVLSPGWVRVGTDGDWWLDVDDFERVWEASRDVAGAGLTGTQAQELEEALVLYSGDLIEGSYSDWCIYERDRAAADLPCHAREADGLLRCASSLPASCANTSAGRWRVVLLAGIRGKAPPPGRTRRG